MKERKRKRRTDSDDRPLTMRLGIIERCETDNPHYQWWEVFEAHDNPDEDEEELARHCERLSKTDKDFQYRYRVGTLALDDMQDKPTYFAAHKKIGKRRHELPFTMHVGIIQRRRKGEKGKDDWYTVYVDENRSRLWLELECADRSRYDKSCEYRPLMGTLTLDDKQNLTIYRFDVL